MGWTQGFCIRKLQNTRKCLFQPLGVCFAILFAKFTCQWLFYPLGVVLQFNWQKNRWQRFGKKKNCNLLVAEKCRPWQAGISLACTSRPEPTACAAARAKSDSARFLASYARPHARHMLCRICRWPPGMTTTISLHLCNLFTKKWGVFLTNFLN